MSGRARPPLFFPEGTLNLGSMTQGKPPAKDEKAGGTGEPSTDHRSKSSELPPPRGRSAPPIKPKGQPVPPSPPAAAPAAAPEKAEAPPGTAVIRPKSKPAGPPPSQLMPKASAAPASAHRPLVKGAA